MNLKTLLLTLLLVPWLAFAGNKTLSVEDVNAALKSNPESLGTIIDVRTPEEYAEGHVPGAINIPHGEIKQHLAKLSPLEKQGLVLYCRSGYRAGKAIGALQDAGFDNVTHMKGDMSAWFDAGFDLQIPQAAMSPK